MNKKQLAEFYKEIEVKRLDGGIIVVNLWKDSEREPYNAIRLMFAYGKIIYTGDMGHYIFGRNVNNIFTFYKGDEINPEYWREKVFCADRPVRNEECDLSKVVELAKRDIEEYFGGELTEEQEQIWEDFCDFSVSDSNPVRVYDDLERLYEELGVDPCERAASIVEQSRGYDRRYIYACEVLQWVSNNLDEWLEKEQCQK